MTKELSICRFHIAVKFSAVSRFPFLLYVINLLVLTDRLERFLHVGLKGHSCSGNRVIQGLGSVQKDNGKLPVLFQDAMSSVALNCQNQNAYLSYT